MQKFYNSIEVSCRHFRENEMDKYVYTKIILSDFQCAINLFFMNRRAGCFAHGKTFKIKNSKLHFLIRSQRKRIKTLMTGELFVRYSV